jgi:hypothetical protein
MKEIPINNSHISHLLFEMLDDQTIRDSAFLTYLEEHVGKVDKRYPMLRGEDWQVVSILGHRPVGYYLKISKPIDEQILTELTLKFS